MVIPDNADEALLLLEAVLKKNVEDGTISPLRDMNILLLETLFNIAKAANDERKRLSSLAEIETVKRDNAFGAAQTPDTLLYILTQIRDLLLVIHKDNPKELEKWGFTVIMTESVNRPRTPPAK